MLQPLRDLGLELHDTLPGLDRGQERLFGKAEFFRDRQPRLRSLVPLHLVGLRQDIECRDAVMGEPLDEPLVALVRLPPDIEQDHDDPDLRRFLDIPFDHRRPRVHHAPGRLGIAVSGEIDAVELVIDEEKVDQLGLARRRARLDQAFPVQEGVDEGGFAHVRAAGKGDLRPFVFRELPRAGCARYKFGGQDLHGDQ